MGTFPMPFQPGAGNSNQWFTNLPSPFTGGPGSSPIFGGFNTGGGGGGSVQTGAVSMNPINAQGSSNTPGVVPPSGSSLPSFPNQFKGPTNAPGMTGIGKGMFAENPLDPSLTANLFGWLQSMIGQGASPFDLSTLLPSTGQTTGPGQLNAPLTPLLQLMQSIMGPQGQIGTLASQGMSAVPQWQTMVDAMQRQIQQGSTNLKEQFNVEGGLAGSPFGQAATDYQLQSNKDLNSLLASLTQQNTGLQLQAGQEVGGAGQFMQGLDQQSIQNMLNEFIRTSPEYNPLLQYMMGGATTFAPMTKPGSGGGILGGILGSIGPILSAIPGLAKM